MALDDIEYTVTNAEATIDTEAALAFLGITPAEHAAAKATRAALSPDMRALADDIERRASRSLLLGP